ncbi:MAG: hypothetical protein RL071_2721 [Pseudomonadota bacterium]
MRLASHPGPGLSVATEAEASAAPPHRRPQPQHAPPRQPQRRRGLRGARHIAHHSPKTRRLGGFPKGGRCAPLRGASPRNGGAPGLLTLGPLARDARGRAAPLPLGVRGRGPPPASSTRPGRTAHPSSSTRHPANGGLAPNRAAHIIDARAEHPSRRKPTQSNQHKPKNRTGASKKIEPAQAKKAPGRPKPGAQRRSRSDQAGRAAIPGPRPGAPTGAPATGGGGPRAPRPRLRAAGRAPQRRRGGCCR